MKNKLSKLFSCLPIIARYVTKLSGLKIKGLKRRVKGNKNGLLSTKEEELLPRYSLPSSKESIAPRFLGLGRFVDL